MVNIFVQINGEWMHALTIPPDDIRRLSIRPLKWLRFATFAALGARGNLLDAPAGNIVNPETEHDELGENYYFQSSDPQHIVDNRGLEGQTNSLASTRGRRHCASFCSRIAQRDGHLCVITGAVANICQATHIIPHGKGDAYIQSIVQERRDMYQDQGALGYPANDINIDATQNGILLVSTLHRRFDLGWSTFLRTPNFALGTDDIPIENLPDGPLPASCTTLQHFVPYDPRDRYPVLQDDVRANLDWSSETAPSTVFLDFAYGVAVVKSWATADFQQVLDDRHNTGYDYPPNTATLYVDEDDGSGNGNGQSEDEEDFEYVPSDQSGGQGHSGMSRSQAMDAVMQISLMFKGHPAGTTFAMLQQKREEEAQVHSQKISQEKVQGWLQEGHATD